MLTQIWNAIAALCGYSMWKWCFIILFCGCFMWRWCFFHMKGVALLYKNDGALSYEDGAFLWRWCFIMKIVLKYMRTVLFYVKMVFVILRRCFISWRWCFFFGWCFFLYNSGFNVKVLLGTLFLKTRLDIYYSA